MAQISKPKMWGHVAEAEDSRCFPPLYLLLFFAPWYVVVRLQHGVRGSTRFGPDRVVGLSFQPVMIAWRVEPVQMVMLSNSASGLL